jgi:hypothetical protein
MDGLGYSLDDREPRSVALLYHRPRPCANPGRGIMMNKQQAIRTGTASWLTD